QRLKNSQAKILITDSDLYERVEKIRDSLPNLKEVILVDQDRENCQNLKTLMDHSSPSFKAVEMNPSDPAFMLYTSGTGTTPVSGIVIPHKAIVQQKKTAEWVLDLKKNDIYWCTSDPGWITGIVYGILAPLSLGTTIVVNKDRFDAQNWFSILEKEKVSVFYSAPTAFRFLEKEDHFAKEYDFSKLRHILSVGEALPPSSIKWAKKIFNLPIYDTWWQTETGAIMIANFLCLPIRQGSMGKPIPGVKALIVDEQAKPVKDGEEGNLAFKPGWPSAITDIWQNRKNLNHYFKNDLYYSGDRACKDKDGYFWFIGRADDVIKTSGERVGPFEVESSLQEHESVLESAVIGKPDKQRGQIIKAFVVLKPNFKPSDVLKEELKAHVKKTMAGHAYPREIEFRSNLPKTKTGKIMRRYLKAKEMDLPTGDISTLDEA
ncbi:AMP-binding protein, partial [Patescibacteria group bacterium]|nr:AMP-binding protein [Patescibacteria group bacterium]